MAAQPRSGILPQRIAGASCLVALCLALNIGDARAQALRIVALGASNTAGMGRGATNMGVPRGQAFPAQLERMLRAKGCNARVTNAGIAGDTTAGMLARLNSAVPNGTRIVILQPGGNDVRRGGSEAGRAANVAAITGRLRARQIDVLVLDRFGAGIQQYRLADGQHFSAEGHAAVAAGLLPRVMGACGAGPQ